MPFKMSECSIKTSVEAGSTTDVEVRMDVDMWTFVRRHARVGWVVACALVMLQCQGTRYAGKRSEIAELPESYDGATVEGEPLDRWCSDFGADRLEALVDRAFEDNLDLRSSWARLKQARAAARQAGARRFPSLNLEGSYSRTEQPTLPDAIRDQVDKNQYRASIGAQYELDLWGRMANLQQAAKLDAVAARADVESMAMSVTSRIATTWFNVVYFRARKDLLEQQLETSKRFLELTRLRFSRGRASAADISQQRQQIESLRGQMANVEAQRQLAQHQLSVLVGEPPTEAVAGERSELPELPAKPAPGVPADLLERRPDVRAAIKRLEAADERTAAAVKDQFPSIRLSFDLFTQTANIQEMFEELFWSATASISQPLFDGGQRFAAIDEAEGRAESLLYQYGKTVLEALKDVEDALVSERQQADFIESLREQVESARRVLRLNRERYARGVASYLRILTALQSLQSLEQQLLEARRQQLSNRVQLCRSLGGTWTRDLEAPDTSS